MERLQGKVVKSEANVNLAILSGQQGETPVTAKDVTLYEKSMTLHLILFMTWLTISQQVYISVTSFKSTSQEYNMRYDMNNDPILSQIKQSSAQRPSKLKVSTVWVFSTFRSASLSLVSKNTTWQGAPNTRLQNAISETNEGGGWHNG